MSVLQQQVEAEAVIRTFDLRKTYGSGGAQVNALAGVDLELPDHQMTAIMGPSGSGKSTLMHCMAGLDHPTGGQVFLGDAEVSALKERQLTQLRRTRIGFIFQAFNLVPTLTAAENITLPLDIAGQKVDRDWFDSVVDRFGLRDRLKHLPSQLSGGQQQRVACARAIVAKPQVILADEPTGNLDSKSAAEVLSLLRSSVDATGQAVVMVTHDPTAAAYSHQVIFLADGKVVDRLANPTSQSVLDKLGALSAAAAAVAR